MSYAPLARGPLGLQAIHTWTSPAGQVLLINDRSTSPQIQIMNLGGWRALPDMNDLRSPNLGRIGENPQPPEITGKTITYEGFVRGHTWEEIDDLANDCLAAFGERNLEGEMAIRPNPVYGAIDPCWVFNARPITMEIGATMQDSIDGSFKFQASFTLGLRLSEPRKFLKGTGYPIESNGHASGDVVTLTAPGFAPTEPYFDIVHAAGATVTLQNNSLILPNGAPAKLVFGGTRPQLPGGSMHVNFVRRAAKVNELSVMGSIRQAPSTWWDDTIPGMRIGDNDITVIGCTSWNCYYWPASW